MIYIDQKYIHLISHKLRNFKSVRDRFNFSCPICGDSTKKANKARGWFLPGDSGYNFKCYNCNAPISFYGVFKKLDPSLFKEYLMEKKFGTSNFVIPKDEPEPIIKSESSIALLDDLLCINEFEDTHPVKKYVIKRMIPRDKWDKIYFAPRFMKWTNQVKNEKIFSDKALKYDHPRLVFPFFDEEGIPFGFSARAFGKEEPKYLVIKMDDSKEKIFGLDTVDFTEKFYVVEGQIDSLFLPNAIAAAGSAFNAKFIQENKENAVIVFDNEPRSKEIMNALEKVIKEGFKVFIWPDYIKEKDINDLIKAGRTQQDVVNLIDKHSWSGLNALLRYKMWRKIYALQKY